MTTRTRSTWTQPAGAAASPRQAGTRRHADIYTMNQDHPQPSASAYNSDAWVEGETQSGNKIIEQEYQGDAVKRNEVGFGEFRDDTWKHKDSEKWNDGKKYDNSRQAAERKAAAVERIARSMHLATERDVAETALELMALPQQAIVSTLKRLEKSSYESLPVEARHRRGLACVKLAARTLGYSADVTDQVRLAHVRDLAQNFMGLPDATLRSMLKVVATARTADDASAPSEEAQSEEAPMAETAGADCLPPAEAGMLAEMTAPPPPAAAPAVVIAPPSPVDELEAIFHGDVAPAPAIAPAPIPTGLPVAASDAAGGIDIVFDDEDDAPEQVASIPGSAVASEQEELDAIFSDLPDVMAQREVLAAQAQAQSGYGPSSRTASTKGARRLGQVQAAKGTEQDAVEASLWR
jgi:hypothetical protein